MKRNNHEQIVVVQDARSAEVLAMILARAEPGEWTLQEERESVLGMMLGGPAQQAPQPMPQMQPMQQALPPSPAAAADQEVETSLTLALEEEQDEAVPAPALPKAPPALPPRPGSSAMSAPAVPPAASVAPPAFVAPVPKAPEKRRFKRFNMEFKVILVCEGKTFRTYSSDVSVGGMALKHKVPPFMLNNHCRVVVSRRDSLENIEFNCRIHGGLDDPRRVEFLDCDPRSVRSFEQWIEKGASPEFSRQKTA